MSYHQPDAASAILARFCLRALLMHRESARPSCGFWRGMPTPSLPPKRALAPRLACALNRPLFVHLCKPIKPRQCWHCGAKTTFQKSCKIVRFIAHLHILSSLRTVAVHARNLKSELKYTQAHHHGSDATYYAPPPPPRDHHKKPYISINYSDENIKSAIAPIS